MSKLRTRMFKTVAALACSAALLAPAAALAIDPIDFNVPVKLEVSLVSSTGIFVPGAQFDVYRVADISEFADFTVTSQFSSFAKDLVDLHGVDKWDELAKRMATYAKSNGYLPAASVKTGEGVPAAFDTLTHGLYLVVGTDAVYNKMIYTSNSFLVCLPTHPANSDEWDYTVEARPKPATPTPAPDPDPILPQTGQLWWPVLALAGVGAGCVGVGVIARRRGEDE